MFWVQLFLFVVVINIFQFRSKVRGLGVMGRFDCVCVVVGTGRRLRGFGGFSWFGFSRFVRLCSEVGLEVGGQFILFSLDLRQVVQEVSGFRLNVQLLIEKKNRSLCLCLSFCFGQIIFFGQTGSWFSLVRGRFWKIEKFYVFIIVI